MQHDPDVQEGLEPGPETTARPTGSAGDRPEPTVLRRIQVQNAIGLHVTYGSEHDRLGLQSSRHDPDRSASCTAAAILFEVMKVVTVYTTDRCSLCVSAKSLLAQRG